MADATTDYIVNVASVPKRSLFRYPGGKTWLVPRVRAWLRQTQPAELIEPFAGGGIVGLTAAFDGLARRVTLVELDDDIAAVWQTLLNPSDSRWLRERILSFRLTKSLVQDTLEKTPGNRREQAFATIVRNRVSRGGIMAPGSGLIRAGENGRGLASRWYPETLARRIDDICAIRDRLEFIQGDGFSELVKRDSKSSAFFIDPPYTASTKRAGARLYAHNQVDHPRLFDLMSSALGDFLMTYDAADEVRNLALQHGFDLELVPMKSTHHARMFELLVGRNLDWARSPIFSSVEQVRLVVT